jgi:hypothetical protein
MDMTKFDSADDPGFKAVVGELRRWVKELIRSENARLLGLGAESSHRHTASGESGGTSSEQQFLRITQGGSQFGPTTVSGGSLFQGNYNG